MLINSNGFIELTFDGYKSTAIELSELEKSITHMASQ